MSKERFQALFVLGPLLAASIVPSLIFGGIYGEWGSNIIWGSLFGLGWCLSAFVSGSIVHDQFSTAIGLIWGWLILIPLYFASGRIWKKLNDRGRKRAAMALGASFLLVVPAHTIMGWDEHGFHLPDYSMHLAASY